METLKDSYDGSKYRELWDAQPKCNIYNATPALKLSEHYGKGSGKIVRQKTRSTVVILYLLEMKMKPHP